MRALKDFIPADPDVCTYAAGAIFPSHTLVGIEVELEKYNNPTITGPTYWRLEHDGSLREGGVEFVLRQPLTGVDLEKAMDELNNSILKAKYEVNQRCSTHVHIDARNMTVEHLQAMVFVYCMVERMLYDVVAPDREDSFYCTPLYKSSLHRKIFADALEKLEFRGCPRYSGINMQALRTYGSLEFRMHDGLRPDHNLTRWIKLLLKLKEGTQKYEGMPLVDILKRYSTDSAESVIKEVFGEGLSRELLVKHNYNQRLTASMRSAQDIILLKHRATLAAKEREWARTCRGDSDVEGIDPDLLNILRAKREEILNG